MPCAMLGKFRAVSLTSGHPLKPYCSIDTGADNSAVLALKTPLFWNITFFNEP